MIVNEDLSVNADGDFEEITKDDISKALAKKLGTTNFVVLSYTLKPLSERIGLLGDHSVLYVNMLDEEGDERKTSFFVKYFPKLEAPAKFADGIGAFKKGDPNYTLLVLSTKRKSRQNWESITDYRTITEKNFEESFFNDREDFVNIKGVEASIKCVIKEIDIFDFSHKLLSGKSFPVVAKDACNRIYELVKPSKKYRNVLCHGDLWATNFLLKYRIKDEPMVGCKFIDFQCGRYVPPSQDVLSVLYLTTSREFRKTYMYQVVGMYYSYLEKHLTVAGYNVNNIIPFDQFLESCEQQKLFAIVQTAIYFPLILISNDAVETLLSDVELNEKALFEDRSYLVLAHMNKDESYIKRLRESIQDLKEYCDYL
ncbi:hypothetical protein NQ317_009596 [Molorchus minor]|uniref:CHK kinase-like domain-containing protein n=1 Tax=Molorchus minor TaxID=1323400 RepID=A0ABQ9IV46_9CUCU|nr:hypothetical protein NQ317_009596 [Molorchus minor]